MIIPSIDLMDGKAVQLEQGKRKVLERTDIEDLVNKFSLYGEIAVIDLDAALGKGSNEHLIKKICKIVDCRVGGGIRSETKANRVLSYGANKVIIGTKAIPNFLDKFNPERLIAAVDSKKGMIVTEGWSKVGSSSTIEKIEELESYCSEFLYTNVDREGLLKGINIPQIKDIRSNTSNQLTYAGGITTYDDVKKLEKINVNSQIGMAIYNGQIDLSKLLIELLDFKKSRGLIPTIVEDTYGRNLMLAYSSQESLRQSIFNRKGIYYSRSRYQIWMKGGNSGNIQELLKVRYDCDRDTLKFTVNQTGPACHNLTDTCFGNKEFTLGDLFEVIKRRIDTGDVESYTAKIAQSEEQIKDKIMEEAKEVATYKDKQNLIWEVSDLTYFLMVLLARNEVNLDDIKNELWRRRK